MAAAQQSDPRVFFAAERTLLAWLRTGLTIIAIGFMISRFGLFLQLLALQSHNPTPAVQLPMAGILGIAFVAIGSLAIACAAIQHMRFIKSLSQGQLPQAYSSKFAVFLAMLIALLGVALVAYLWLS